MNITKKIVYLVVFSFCFTLSVAAKPETINFKINKNLITTGVYATLAGSLAYDFFANVTSEQSLRYKYTIATAATIFAYKTCRGIGHLWVDLMETIG